MLENQIPKYQFTVMDHTDKKEKTILSITDLGEIGRKRSITVRKENKITLHEITIIEKKPLITLN